MSKSGIALFGFEEVASQLESCSDIPDDVALKILIDGGEPVLNRMIERVPVRTGDLKKSLKIGRRLAKGRKGGSRSIEIGAMGKDGNMANLVESGHGGPKPAPPHPFAWPAYEESKAEAYDRIAEGVRQWLNG